MVRAYSKGVYPGSINLTISQLITRHCHQFP